MTKSSASRQPAHPPGDARTAQAREPDPPHHDRRRRQISATAWHARSRALRSQGARARQPPHRLPRPQSHQDLVLQGDATDEELLERKHRGTWTCSSRSPTTKRQHHGGLAGQAHGGTAYPRTDQPQELCRSWSRAARSTSPSRRPRRRSAPSWRTSGVATWRRSTVCGAVRPKPSSWSPTATAPPPRSSAARSGEIEPLPRRHHRRGGSRDRRHRLIHRENTPVMIPEREVIIAHHDTVIESKTM